MILDLQNSLSALKKKKIKGQCEVIYLTWFQCPMLGAEGTAQGLRDSQQHFQQQCGFISHLKNSFQLFLPTPISPYISDF